MHIFIDPFTITAVLHSSGTFISGKNYDFPEKSWRHKHILLFYDIILRKRVLLPLTNVPEECRIAVMVKGSIPFRLKNRANNTKYLSISYHLLLLYSFSRWSHYFSENNYKCQIWIILYTYYVIFAVVQFDD